MTAKFQRLERDARVYFRYDQETVDLLESITPVEKALAVPYVRMYQVDPSTGRPVHADSMGLPKAPINLQFIAPPRFGAPAEHTFRERPPVSLKRVSIKSQTPRGVILYSDVDLSFTVHRPDVIFGDEGDGDRWSSLLIPGSVHVLEYGWSSSGKHPLLNGTGHRNRSTGVHTPSRSAVTIQVINYDFTVGADMQFNFVVHAKQNGDVGLRGAVLGGLLTQAERDAIQAASEEQLTARKRPQPFTRGDDLALLGKLQKIVRSIDVEGAIKGVGRRVKFSEVVDSLLAPAIDGALRNMGYSHVELKMGDFNPDAGTSVGQFGSRACGGKWIGDFELPYDLVVSVIAKTFRTGQQMTFYNFTTQFLEMFRDPSTWDRTDDRHGPDGRSLSTIPDVRVTTSTDGDRAVLYIVDIKNEVPRVDGNSKLRKGSKASVDDIKRELRNVGIPYFALLRANSFFLDAKFNVILDDQVKSIAMRQALAQTREEIVSQPDAVSKRGAVSPEEIMYASALEGELTQIGNFAFGVFSSFWLDFGVPRWNGPFFVMEREDVIEGGGFTTTVRVRSTGEDPLGTQERR